MNIAVQLTQSIDANEGGTLSGDDTSARGEMLQAVFGTKSFLDAGHTNGNRWFEISPEVAAYIKEQDGGPAMLSKIQQVMDRLNAFLARTDVSDEMKMKMLSSLLGAPADYDDIEDKAFDEQWAGLGTVIAEVMVGRPDTLECVFDGDSGNEATNVEELGAMCASFEKQMTEFMNDNKISVEPDKSMAYLATLSLVAEADARRRKGLYGQSLVDDIRATEQRIVGEIENRKKELANTSQSQEPA